MLNLSVAYCNDNIFQKILLALSPKLRINSQNDTYIIKYENHTIWINKDTGLPDKTVSIDEETQTEHRNIYKFELDKTSNDDVLGINKNEYAITEY